MYTKTVQHPRAAASRAWAVWRVNVYPAVLSVILRPLPSTSAEAQLPAQLCHQHYHQLHFLQQTILSGKVPWSKHPLDPQSPLESLLVYKTFHRYV